MYSLMNPQLPTAPLRSSELQWIYRRVIVCKCRPNLQPPMPPTPAHIEWITQPTHYMKINKMRYVHFLKLKK